MSASGSRGRSGSRGKMGKGRSGSRGKIGKGRSGSRGKSRSGSRGRSPRRSKSRSPRNRRRRRRSRSRSNSRRRSPSPHKKNEKGFIARLDDRGFGFIEPERDEVDIYFHCSSVVGMKFDDLRVNDPVEYSSELDEKQGKPRAVKVVFLGDARGRGRSRSRSRSGGRRDRGGNRGGGRRGGRY